MHCQATSYDIIGINLLTKKNAPPPGNHVFQPTGIIFELIQDIIETNLQTKFHDDWTINVASRVFTRKNAPPLFHDDRKINVTSRVLTRFYYNSHIYNSHIRKIAPPPW
ncbi:hypothetical protein DPMN_048948 [Dreissena polymorpha]|uniref:Uncharacterized protein n=1 Tax=Dreissena polymorpha TaxID=45954 RepID=A0A9D4I4E4_DREPO|nr:hypothetical protein DPMN_048948 [Dreissena polymorpha]